MALSTIADKIVETDVLVMGGGIGGCPAAAKAADKGLRVTLIEKAKTDRSGCAGAGIDHYGPVPSASMSALDLLETDSFGSFDGPGRFYDPNMIYRT